MKVKVNFGAKIVVFSMEMKKLLFWCQNPLLLSHSFIYTFALIITHNGKLPK